MTAQLTIRHDVRSGFAFVCTCGWEGTTQNLVRAAAPIAEHLRGGCAVKPLAHPYDPDRFARDADTKRAKAQRRQKPPPRPTAPAKRAPSGDRNGNAKLDAQQVREIRHRYAVGATQVDIARAFGISQPTVGAIVRHETWQDID